MNAITRVDDKQSVAAPPGEQVTVPAPAKRKRGRRMALMLAVPLLLVAGGAYMWAIGGRFQETDNANLRQARVSIAAAMPGRVIDVAVHDNQQVKAGDVLFVVDPEPYRIALAQADAALETARLGVGQLRAAYNQALAQQQIAQSELEFLEADLGRARELQKKGVGTLSSLDEAQRAVDKGREQLAAARDNVAGALAALGGVPDIDTDSHPSVLAAMAARDKAAYQLAETSVRAPADGIVSQASSFKVGQYVAAGTPLFALVETADTWIEANFKETQLTNMHVGQTAEVVLDTYPDRPLTATVESIGAGTGAEFSVLPAQNATGNWVKVTQRVPVRLKVDGGAADLLLRTGMSAVVSVDTEVARGFGSLSGTAVAAPAR